MTDQTDSNIFSNFFSSGSSGRVISSKIQVCERNSDYYNLQHENRGIAMIFNNVHFDNDQATRQGSDVDKIRLEIILKKLEFEVRSYEDLTYGEITHVLQQASEENHTHNDCLVVCVMSHGDEGKIYAKDIGYPPDILWEPFTGKSCTTLNGKPKMFFIQACRGDMVDEGVQIRNKSETDSSKDETYSIPAMADILVMYATYNGYFSWRSPLKGSWFIQALCEILEKHGSKKDLLTLLTLVNRKVALDYQSFVPVDSSMDKKKQICTIVSMLTRLMAFPTKEIKNH